MCPTILKIQNVQPRKACDKLSGMAAVVLSLALVCVSGCGNPFAGGNKVVNPVAFATVESEDQENVPPNVPPNVRVVREPRVPGLVVVQPDIGASTNKPGIVGGLQQVLSSTPLEDEQKDALRRQMEEANTILYNTKQQNKEAMRQAFRQQRLRGAGSPNIIVIVADDLSLSDLSSYGPTEIQTPNIDRLAKSGTTFTQAYSASPVSQDARWCLVAGPRPDQATGRYKDSTALQLSDVTVAEVMWKAGYTTGIFGHWGVMAGTGPADPDGHGYDQWLGTLGPADEPQPYPEVVFQNQSKLRLTKNAEGKQGQFAQDFFVTEAAEFIGRNIPQKPVFLQFFFSVPGTRRTVPKLDRYTDKHWPDSVKIRAAAITRMDSDIGILMQKLQQLGQLSNTVFVITSDTAGNTEPESTPSELGQIALRGQHGDLYEGGLRVPLIISGTSAIPSMKSPAVVAAWDLAPTIFQLANVTRTPKRPHGQSILASLKPNAVLPQRFLKWETKQGTPGIAVRYKDWKFIRLAGSSEPELYNLTADPTESKNVAAEQPDVLAEIQAKLPPSESAVARMPR